MNAEKLSPLSKRKRILFAVTCRAVQDLSAEVDNMEAYILTRPS